MKFILCLDIMCAHFASDDGSFVVIKHNISCTCTYICDIRIADQQLMP